MRESVLRAIENAKAIALVLEKTDQKQMASAIERLAQELYLADERERIWRKALMTACSELQETRTEE